MNDPRLDRDLAPAELDCEDVRSLLGRHLDGELEEPHAGRLRGHLLSCAACRARFQDERSLKRWFVAPADVRAPAGFAARVAALAESGAMPREFHDEPVAVPQLVAAAAPDRRIARLERFTLGLLALAASALLALSVALAIDAGPPRPTVLLADPLPDALQRLEELNREERGAAISAVPVAGPVSGPALGARP